MSRPPIFTTPRNKLKEKLGEGGLPPETIKQGQAYLESNPVDFTPYAADLLHSLKNFMGGVYTNNHSSDEILLYITKIIMQLKANGSMFHYQLLSMTSDVLLRFMEKAKTVDQDFIDIITVYTNILSVIVSKRLTGNGGHEGYTLTSELSNACERYNKKHGIS
jgi:hypothetical protein